MTVLVPDPTIRAMDDQLGSVVLGDLPTDLDGLLLSRHDHGRALPTFAFHRPVVSVRDYMLVLLSHLRCMFLLAKLSRSGRGFQVDRHFQCVDRRSSAIDRQG